jgi:hypothetical protein
MYSTNDAKDTDAALASLVEYIRCRGDADTAALASTVAAAGGISERFYDK